MSRPTSLFPVANRIPTASDSLHGAAKLPSDDFPDYVLLADTRIGIRVSRVWDVEGVQCFEGCCSGETKRDPAYSAKVVASGANLGFQHVPRLSLHGLNDSDLPRHDACAHACIQSTLERIMT
jgi:hypothetical protein